MLFLVLLCIGLFRATPEARVRAPVANPYTGRWQLNMSDPTGCSDPMLQLMGVSKTLRDMIHTLNVVESFEFTERTLKLGRSTLYTTDLVTLQLGRAEQVKDRLLGDVLMTVEYVTGGRINTMVTRTSDRATFSSVRRVLPNGQSFSNSMNFTAADGQQASCVRYFNRLKASVYVHSTGKAGHTVTLF